MIPEPPPMSQQQAKARLEQLAALLDAAVDWEKRSAALQEMEALIEAGATQLHFFLEFLKALMQPLRSQLADR